ncbi:MAG TPA: 30S ribosomal protein S6 [Clostridia bacterium]|nr:30S ribosomal protein S6 [Clostridia bacterium]
MNNYQLLYIIDNGIGEEEKATVVDKYSEVVESLGGTVNSVEKWGVKKFAYPIQYKKEGYYVLVKFAADATVPTEIERQMKINDKIIRQMITRI